MGEGGFGKAYKGVDTKNYEQVVLKCKLIYLNESITFYSFGHELDTGSVHERSAQRRNHRNERINDFPKHCKV